ncbi:phosphate/phosphite/phosphonate ABC transporter substrate-binding protein [Candidatus Thioglobus sp.]|nr:phosphate/phosphite/phosphonate ABC transporter substrate-binding protein [Candidatus Thioglobus sp.]
MLAFISFCLSSVVVADSKSNPDVLRVAILPDENASELIKQNKKLQLYLENRLDKKIELVVTTDYSSMIEAMRFGRLELAYFGALSYVMAKERSEIEAFAAQMKKGSIMYHGVIIVNNDSMISNILDVRGKTMAYGDPASTSSHLIPRAHLLTNANLDIDDYKAVYLGSHDAVALNVQNGNADAGGLSKKIFEHLVEREMISLDKVQVIAISNPFPNYPWTMQSSLDPELKEKIKQAFYDLDDPEITKPLKADGFMPVTDADYDVVRKTRTLLSMD